MAAKEDPDHISEHGVRVVREPLADVCVPGREPLQHAHDARLLLEAAAHRIRKVLRRCFGEGEASRHVYGHAEAQPRLQRMQQRRGDPRVQGAEQGPLLRSESSTIQR